jgi:hypothetical protein
LSSVYTLAIASNFFELRLTPIVEVVSPFGYSPVKKGLVQDRMTDYVATTHPIKRCWVSSLAILQKTYLPWQVECVFLAPGLHVALFFLNRHFDVSKK